MKKLYRALALASISGSLALLFSLGASGCLPDAPNNNSGPSDMSVSIDAPASLSAEQMFNTQVLPLLSATCGACHSLDVGVGPGFLASASADPKVYDPYPTIVAWPGFIVENPELSVLLTKGQHEGPSLTIDQYNAVLAWLNQEKAERDASAVTPFEPQVPPFSIVLSTSKSNPQYNIVQLSQISPNFVGAYITFVAMTLNTDGTGLEISDLRFVNVKPNMMPGDQRSIHFESPLFVLWRAGVPFPDPANSFAGFDKTVTLGQNDPGITGVSIVPGIVVLDQYRPGYSLSIVFSIIETAPPVLGSNPCSANQLSFFTTNFTVAPNSYMTGTTCAQAGMCHSASYAAGGIDMSALTMTNPDLSALCEQLKFYNGLSILQQNMDPNGTVTHPFKFTGPNCTAAGFSSTSCFMTFSMLLDTWRTTN